MTSGSSASSRRLRTRFTFDATDDFSAIWSPDGADIAFTSRRKGHLDLYRKTASGADREEVLLDGPGGQVSDQLVFGREVHPVFHRRCPDGT